MSDMVPIRELPDIADVRASLSLVMSVQALSSPQQAVDMTDAWRALKKKVADVESHFKPRKKKAREAWEQWCDDEHTVLDPIKDAVEKAAKLLSEYELERRREAQIEAARQAQIQREADVARVAAQAQALEQAGTALDDPEMLYEAHVLRETPPAVAVTPIQAPAGMATMRDYWEGVVVDKIAALKYIVDHPEHLSLIEFDSSVMRTYADLYKTRLGQLVPGLTAVNKPRPRDSRKK